MAQLLAMDWETQGLNCQRPIIGTLITESRQIYNYTKPEDMRNKILELAKKHNGQTHVYAHNMAFDFAVLWQKEWIKQIKDKNMLILIPKKQFWVIWEKKIHFLDTMTFWKTSLEQAAISIGAKKKELVPKLKEKLHSEEPQEYTFLERQELRQYCNQDTQIALLLIEEVKHILQELGYNPHKIQTAGKTAMTCYRTWLRKKGLEGYIAQRGIVHKNRYPEDIKKAYKPAYDICFQTGHFEEVTEIDINKHYSHILSTMTMPDLINEKKIYFPIQKYGNEALDWIGVMKCTVKAPPKSRLNYGFLLTRKDGKVIAPLDQTIEDTWTIIEIKKALELGYELLSCDWAIKYRELKVGNIFKGWFDEMFELYKKNKGTPKGQIIKLLMNSLGGKFAQRSERHKYEVIERKDIREWQNKGYEWHKTLEQYYIMKTIEPEVYVPSHVNYIISTLMTANARIKHYEAFSRIPPEDLIELNTDNIKFKGNHKDKFKVGEEMGEWKIEHEDEEAYFLGENTYWIGNSIRCSGINRKDVTKDDITNQKEVETKQMVGIEETLRTGQLDDYGLFKQIKKQLKLHSKMTE